MGRRYGHGPAEDFFATNFTRSYAAGVDPRFFAVVGNVGAGQTVSQASGNLLLASGTTANAETILRSTRAFSGNLTLREIMTLSQRIANNTFAVELVDVLGNDLAFTINSATSVTVTLPSHKFTAENVGQSLSIGAILNQPSAIPGRYVIASVATDTITLTVSGWPSSGAGRCSLYGWNFHRIAYDGTTAAAAKIDAGRYGWATGDTTITINTTASPGHVAVLNVEDGVATWMDGLTASSTSVQNTVRGSRINRMPDESVNLWVQVRMTNGPTNPASTTTATIGGVSVEKYETQGVALMSVRPQSLNSALPMTLVASSATGTSSMQVQGTAASGGTAVGNPLAIATVARNAMPSYSNTSVNYLVLSLSGQLINKPFAVPEADWQYAAAASGIANTTTAVTFKSAGGASLRNYVTGIDFFHDVLTNATELAVRDGAAGTVIWRTKLPAGAVGRGNIQFSTPLKGTANTLLEVVTLTASGVGAVYFNAQGYTAL